MGITPSTEKPKYPLRKVEVSDACIYRINGFDIGISLATVIQISMLGLNRERESVLSHTMRIHTKGPNIEICMTVASEMPIHVC